GRRARASAKRPHAAWRGCSRCLRSASTVEGPCPRQQEQGCLRTASPKKEKHRRSLRGTVASVAGSLARPSVCWSPETCPRCRRFRDPASPPLCVAAGRQCFAAQTNRHNNRASAGTTEKQPKADRARLDTNARTTVLFLSGPEAQKLRFQGRRTTSLRFVVLSAQQPQRNHGIPHRAAPGGCPAVSHRVPWRLGWPFLAQPRPHAQVAPATRATGYCLDLRFVREFPPVLNSRTTSAPRGRRRARVPAAAEISVRGVRYARALRMNCTLNHASISASSAKPQVESDGTP